VHHNQLHVGKPKVTNIVSDKQLKIVSDNEQVTLMCIVSGDDISGGYWERVNSGSLSDRNNMSSLSNNNKTIAMTINRARPEHSGRYRCVAYSQWGVAQSRNVQVTITSKSIY